MATAENVNLVIKAGENADPFQPPSVTSAFDSEAIPPGPRVLMERVEYDNSDFIHFVKVDPETDLIEDSYMMPIKRWENMDRPEKIELRLEAG